MSDLNQNKIALVTGGAIRIGRAISMELAEAGYDLVIGYHSSKDQAFDLQKTIFDLGRQCELVHADLREPNAPRTMVESVQKIFLSLIHI